MDKKMSWELLALTYLLVAQGVSAQQEECYSSGSIVGAVFGTLIVLAVLGAAGYAFWKYYWRKRRGKQLTLATGDPETGVLGDQQYAFDNPGFLSEDALPHKNRKPSESNATNAKNANKDSKAETLKGAKHTGKWQAWSSPLTALVGGSGKQNEKRRALDDSFIGEPEINVVALRGHDFTGLGFNICGNMRDGIFVRDVLHRGPASESGRVAAGDRLVGVNISFKHMVFEDALTILSYASPYDVQLEVEKCAPGTVQRGSGSGSGKRSPSVGPADRLCHPFYRSQSIDDLAKMRKSSMSARRANAKKNTEDSPGPVGVIGISGSGRCEEAKLEQASSASDNPRMSRPSASMPKPERAKKPNTKLVEDVKVNISPLPVDKHTKFGVRVLPVSVGDLKPITSSETSQNEQNTKIEQYSPHTENEEKLKDEINTSNMETKIADDMGNTKVEKLKGTGHDLIVEAKVEVVPSVREDVIKNNEKLIFEMDKIIENKENKIAEKLEEVGKNIIQRTNDSHSVVEDVVDNIPTEMPEEMHLAAMAAKTNRKSLNLDRHLPIVAPKPDLDFSSGGESAADNDTPRKNMKRKAPPPPTSPTPAPANSNNAESDSDDSDIERQNTDIKSKGGGTTIELNSAHITIHQSPKEEEESENVDSGRNSRDRKTASLGDLSRLDTDQPMSIPLERAVSLDLADVTPPQQATNSDPSTTGTAKKRKAPGAPEDELTGDAENSDVEEMSLNHNHHFVKKEPRLMDAGMSDTFKRKLKKSSDWGTLEEAMLVTSESQPSASHHVVLVTGSDPISPPQSPTITSSFKAPSITPSDVISVQVVTSSIEEPLISSKSLSSDIKPMEEPGSPTTSTISVADSGSIVEIVSSSIEHTGLLVPDETMEPPELPTSPVPISQSVREFSLASPSTSPLSNFHHSMTYISTIGASPPSSPQHHVTEIQVLTGGNVSSPTLLTETAETASTIRHGTSGGNLLLLPTVTANLINRAESPDETLSSFNSLRSDLEDEPAIVVESPTRNNVTVMAINTNGTSNHVDHTINHMETFKARPLSKMDDISVKTETKREVLQITPGELDSVMMSHSHYLQSTQSPDPSAGSSSTFEQWVFLDGATPINGVRHFDGLKEDTEVASQIKTNTTTMMVNMPPRQSVTHIVLEPESTLEADGKSKLTSSHGSLNT